MEPPDLASVLRSAALLQRAVPEAVLVGGAAAAYYAGHRDSFDHDHVMRDLQDRYLEVLEAVEATDGWVTSVRASSPPLTLLGSLGGIEAGLRQLRRTRPLEVEVIDVGAGTPLRVPTLAETLRVKAYLVLQRNATRDYLDVAAMSTGLDLARSAEVIDGIDDYYSDRSGEADSVVTGVVQRLSEPAPRDTRTTRQLTSYRNLNERWHDWSAVVDACQAIADAVLARREGR